MQTLALSITGMTCGHCVRSVRTALGAVPGAEVHDVQVGSARLTLDASTDFRDVLAAVGNAGYDAAIAGSPDDAEHAVGGGRACCTPAPATLARASAADREPRRAP